MIHVRICSIFSGASIAPFGGILPPHAGMVDDTFSYKRLELGSPATTRASIESLQAGDAVITRFTPIAWTPTSAVYASFFSAILSWPAAVLAWQVGPPL